jgi:single-stranded DNA-binding protein
MTNYANVELVGRLAGIPLMENGKRMKRKNEEGKEYFATMVEPIATARAKDGSSFYTFTVVVDNGNNSSEWIQCISFDKSILEQGLARGDLVCVRGRLSVRNKKNEKGEYRTIVRVMVREVLELVEPPVRFGRIEADQFSGTPF